MSSYKVISQTGFEVFFNRNTQTVFIDPLDAAKSYAERVNGTIYYENTSQYRFVKDGKTCKGSERWLPL